MKRLILSILLIISMGMVSLRAMASNQQNCRVDFLDQSLNKSMRDYCDSVLACGWTFFGEMEGCTLFSGKWQGIDDVNVIVYGRPNMQSVEASLIIFPKGKHWKPKSDYEFFYDNFVEAYGKPALQEDNEKDISAIWIFEAMTITLGYDKNKGTTSWMWLNLTKSEDSSNAQQTKKGKTKKKKKDDEIDFESEIDLQALLQTCTEDYETTHDADDLQCMIFCNEKLGNIYSKKGWHNMGVRYYQQALQAVTIYENPKGPVYLECCHNLAIAFFEMGDIPKALEYLEEVLALNDQLKNDSSETYFIVLRTAAIFYETAGYYAESEAMNERIRIELAHANIPNKTERYINSLHDQATLAMRLGNYESARRYLNEEMAILRKTYREPHLRYNICYGGLAIIDIHYDKKYREGLQKIHRALRNITDPKDHDSQAYAASCYTNMSVCYTYLGQPDSAIAAQKKSLEIYRTVYNDQHPKYANALINLAFAYAKKGDNAQAITLYQEAQKILEKAYNKQHPHVISSIYNQAIAYASSGKYEEAEKAFREAIQLVKTNYEHALDYMSEYQREQYWNQSRQMIEYPDFNKFIYRFYKYKPSLVEFAYDNELFSKGLLLASSDMVRRSIEDSGDSELVLQYAQLSKLREQIYRMESANSESQDLNTFRHRADSLEKELTRKSAIFRQKDALWRISWKDIRNHLTDNQIAIEFTRLQLAEDTAIYCALLLKKEMEHPQMIPLFEEDEVSRILLRTTPDEQYDYTKSGGRLKSLIWDRLLPYLEHDNTVFFAATGVLHQVAIETLPFSNDVPLSAKYHIVRLSSTRELAMTHLPGMQSSATLYGGIYYDVDMSDLAAQSMSYSNLAMAGSRAVVDESMRAGVHYLPGTKKEVEQIRDILQPNHIATKVYTSDAANEESFKALSGQKRNILHIATHGFYWSDSTAHKKRYFAKEALTPDNTPVTIDPLRRSGLLFAGANIALRGHSSELPANVQDGILTSQEISLLDLRGADMVILSACETGKGEITGEGVFGLQRAFKMAGVQTILMSLWPVDDDATQMMMSSFYRHWILQYETKRDAFIHAQEEVKQKYPQPSYWAAFVLLD